jgi:hypothetical protein
MGWSLGYHEVQAKGVVERQRAVFLECLHYLEPSWCQDDCKRDPKSAKGRESSGTKGIANSHLPEIYVKNHNMAQGLELSIPHSRKQLHQPSIGIGQGYDQIRMGDAPRPQVYEGEHKGR